MARFKKFCVPLLLVATLVLQLCTAALATRAVENATANYRGIHIVVNGTQINPCDSDGKAIEPFIIDGTTYLPVRAVAGALGLIVGWEAATSTVTLSRGGETNYGEGEPAASHGAKTVPLVYRDIKLVIDGEIVVPTDTSGKTVEPFIIDGTTYLPVRAVAGALGLTVGWDDATSTVTLDAPAPVEPSFLLTRETEETRTGEGFATKTYKTMKTYQYDRSGRCTERILYSPDGTMTNRYTYDGAGRRLQETCTEGNTVITYTYSETGMLLNEKYTSDDRTVEHAYTYDSADRVTKYVMTYTDSNGVVMPESGTTTYRYDKAGRLLETALSRRDYSASERVEYDAAGNIVKRTETVNNRAETWTYTHDKNGNTLSARSDSNRQYSYTYDAEGNQTSCVYVHDGMIDTTVCTYKNGHKISSVYAGSDGASVTETWSYSTEGDLLFESFTSSKEPSYTITYVRSDDGRQLRVVEAYADGSTKTDVTTYDEYGNIVAREITEPGLWERYTYEYTEQ